MSNYDPDKFLSSTGSPSAFDKNDPVGTTVTGTIAEKPVVAQQTDIQTGKPLEWDNGDPKLQLIVTLQTSLRTSDDDDGLRRVYVKGSTKSGCRSLHDAVATAVKESGAKGLEVGGTLAVTFIGTEPSQTKGFNDRKLYSATYVPPAAVEANAFLGTSQPASVAVTPAAAAPAPAAPAPTSPVDIAKSILQAGGSAADAAAASGLPETTVAALANTLTAA